MKRPHEGAAHVDRSASQADQSVPLDYDSAERIASGIIS